VARTVELLGQWTEFKKSGRVGVPELAERKLAVLNLNPLHISIDLALEFPVADSCKRCI
jgi:hypothetical protein